MGVPAFFRWISCRYPSIISHCIELKSKRSEGENIEIDKNLPNPNGIEVDNLYLDMNGIIHPCSHPQNKPAPETQEQMFDEIAKYIDRLMNVVRPRKLLYLAIDGVAPRAKMNQQRSRRFRASRDQKINNQALEDNRDLVKKKGYNIPELIKTEPFDSNCITPGTKFMDDLSKYLINYVSQRLKSETGWQDILIILSDSSVPGEGEHKIMAFIRKQRAKSSYNPNLVHCIYGADADLIMLGLVTHEPNFIIIREDFRPNQHNNQCQVCMKYGHKVSECKGIDEDYESTASAFQGLEEEFLFVRLSVLREYLQKEFDICQETKTLCFERLIDDWILICFLVGNDFLPHLPSLEIREGAVDRLVNIYKNRILTFDGYLSENGFLNLKNFKIILNDIGMLEDETFKQRADKHKIYQQRNKQNANRLNDTWVRDKFEQPNLPLSHSDTSLQSSSHISRSDSNVSISSFDKRPLKRTFNQRESMEADNPPTPYDPVRLGEEGWRKRYYQVKFDIDEKDIESYRRYVAHEYLIGVSWVLQYYYQGCVSWSWYYPFHYSPFASDCGTIESLDIDWSKTKSQIFKPFEQLMAVLPESSQHLLPVCYHSLQNSDESPLIDFYPTEFKVDLNGKQQEWQGVSLLPFIDEKRLLKCMDEDSKLTPEEEKLNSFGDNLLFLRESHNVGEEITKNSPLLNLGNFVSLSDFKHFELFGDIQVLKSLQDSRPTFFDLFNNEEKLQELNPILCLQYRDPTYSNDTIFFSKLLNDAKIPRGVLKPTDYPRENRYTPTLNFNENRSSSFHLASPARRFIQHSLPHFQRSNYDNYNRNRNRNNQPEYDSYDNRPHSNHFERPRDPRFNDPYYSRELPITPRFRQQHSHQQDSYNRDNFYPEEDRDRRYRRNYYRR